VSACNLGLDVTIWDSGLDVRHFGMIFGKWKRVTTNPARLTPIEIGQGVTYKEAKLTFFCQKYIPISMEAGNHILFL
jgi:hypothetical protein